MAKKKPAQPPPVTSLEALAAEVRRRIGRGSTRTVRDWFSRGCPGKDARGRYDVDAVVAWVEANIVPPKPEEEPLPDGQLRPPKDWHEERSHQQALSIEQERLIKQRELVPASVIAEMLEAFGVEQAAQLDQLVIEIPRMVDPAACDRDRLKDTVQKRCDQARHRMADLLDEWSRFRLGFDTSLDEPDEHSDPEPEPASKSGSPARSRSRKKSAPTRDRTGSTTGSNSGERKAGRSKSSSRKKPK